ncbi:MAG: class D sortase [Lachnospiraceae bacterium]|nr:class D sortase [Lachnospiraceae bacterium]
MKHERKNSRIEYVLIPVFSAILISICYLLVSDTLFWSFYEQWKSVFVTGEIAYVENDFQNLVKKEERDAGEGLVKGKLYGTISCSEKELYAPLYYGDTEEILQNGAGTYEGYGVPGQGTTILTGAHDATYYGALEQVEPGDVMQVDTYWGTYCYQVEEKKIAKVSDIEVYALQEGETLIMYTCYPFGAESEERLERCFVYAKKITEEN